jgi:hypothetical protein
MAYLPGFHSVDQAILDTAAQAGGDPSIISKWKDAKESENPPPIHKDEFDRVEKDVAKRAFALMDRGKLSGEQYGRILNRLDHLRGATIGWESQSRIRETLHDIREQLDGADNEMDMSVS